MISSACCSGGCNLTQRLSPSHYTHYTLYSSSIFWDRTFSNYSPLKVEQFRTRYKQERGPWYCSIDLRASVHRFFSSGKMTPSIPKLEMKSEADSWTAGGGWSRQHGNTDGFVWMWGKRHSQCVWTVFHHTFTLENNRFLRQELSRWLTTQSDCTNQYVDSLFSRLPVVTEQRDLSVCKYHVRLSSVYWLEKSEKLSCLARSCRARGET